MPCVTSGGEISDLIVTQPEVLSFKLWSLLLFGTDSKYKYHSYIFVTIKTVSKPHNTIELGPNYFLFSPRLHCLSMARKVSLL